jgi:hypothetical protein
MRFLAQRITTGDWLTRDLPVTEPTLTRELSGPGGIDGTINPEMREVVADDGMRLLEPWATVVYGEDDGEIRGAGIVVTAGYEGDKVALSCPGFTTYPHGIPVTDNHKFGAVDPLDAVRWLWTYLQAFNDGDLGMVVDDTTSDVTKGSVAEPYGIAWWDNTDIGDEIDNLASETPFDYAEKHTWADDNHTTVEHRLLLGYPRLGRRRDDMRFAGGENITNVIPVTADGSTFANDVFGIGKGTGVRTIRARSVVRDGRLRRPTTLVDRSADKQRLDSMVERYRVKVSQIRDISSVTIVDHPNARVAAIRPGDDILIEADLPWLGEIDMWVRVTAVAQDAFGDTAVLSTRRASSFTYTAPPAV